MRKNIFLSVAIFVVMMVSQAWAGPADLVHFNDANLKALVEAELGVTDPTESDMLNLESLSAEERGIANLTGLEYALNLQYLRLPDNIISNITHLSGLTKLNYLELGGNQISDITHLSGLTNLSALGLGGNDIGNNISPLSGLTGLVGLNLAENGISNISHLSGLSILQEVELQGNQISNISSLSNLTNLEVLILRNNHISDIEPLSNLESLRELNLEDNPLNRDSYCVYYPMIESHNHDIVLIPAPPEDLDCSATDDPVVFADPALKAAVEEALGIENPTQFEMLMLHGLDASRRGITNLTGIEYAKNLKWLNAYHNQISDIRPLLNLGQLQKLHLEDNPLGEQAYCIHLTQIVFNNPGIELYYPPKPVTNVNATDGAFADKVRITWDPAPCSGPMTFYYRVYRASEEEGEYPISDWQTATSFDDTTAVPYRRYKYPVETAMDSKGNGSTFDDQSEDYGWCGISSTVYFADQNLKAAVEEALGCLDPTEFDMLMLKELDASNRGVTNLTGIEYATNLRELYAFGNQISDLAPVSGLTNLQVLDIKWNQISDITPVLGLANLQALELGHNDISDISPLSGLTGLQKLFLYENEISNITPLSNLTNLAILHLVSNDIANIKPLLGLMNLELLYLMDNPLNEQAYCSDLQTILDNNPDMPDFWYSWNHSPPTGVTASDGTFDDKVRVTWDEHCRGPWYWNYYQVYRSQSDDPCTAVAISDWQDWFIDATTFEDTTADSSIPYYYWVKVAYDIDPNGVPSGATDFSTPDIGWCGGLTYSLKVSSTAGGSVTVPGEGTFVYPIRQFVSIEAVPIDANFYFVNWSGSAVDAGAVTDPWSSTAGLSMDANCTLKANFETVLTTIYVGASDQNDLNEHGTEDQPISGIQDAIDVALSETEIVVGAGMYEGGLVLGNKDIQLIAQEPNDPNDAVRPVIVGEANEPAISFSGAKDANCLLSGFVITGGKAGIVCNGVSPVIANCIITGNQGYGILCIDSNAVLVNCTITGNYGDPGPGGEYYPDVNMYLVNYGGALYSHNSHVQLINCILWNNMPDSITVGIGAEPIVSFCDIEGGWSGQGNLNTDPYFIDPGYWDDGGTPGDVSDDQWIEGDYHLMSDAGRRDLSSQVWVTDQITSPCIDTGDPSSPVGQEPVPNGGIINMGAYGGTSQASKSPQEPNVLGPVRFGDPNLKAAVEGRLGIEDPNATDMLSLTELVATNLGISDLTGLEYATNLTHLELDSNKINDIYPLWGLKNLEMLSLMYNPLDNAAYCRVLYLIASDNPGISLHYRPNPNPPTGVSASDGIYADRIEIVWDDRCNGPKYTSYFRVYSSISSDPEKAVPISEWQTSTSFADTMSPPVYEYYYWVKAAADQTAVDVTDYSAPDTGWRRH